jgi:membrane protease YdiL (CAAX protease family)
MKSHKKIFSSLGFAILVYVAISQALSIVAGIIIGVFAPKALMGYDFALVLSSVIQYIIAFPVFCFMMRKIPASAPVGEQLGVKKILKYGAVCMFFMYVGSYISTFLMTNVGSLLGEMPENSIDTLMDNTNILLSVLIVGLIGPIFEELMFRKLLIDRLTPYGDVIAIFFPSLMFALFHGNFYQFFYAFLLGVIFSYIYVKTGKIIYSTILHMFINLFCGVLPSAVFSMLDYEELLELAAAGQITEEYVAANMLPLALFVIYTYGMLAMVGVGLFIFLRNIKNVHINKGAVRFPKGTGAEVIFFNLGTIAFIGLCIVLIALNTFSV